jgi:hypothetical protein
MRNLQLVGRNGMHKQQSDDYDHVSTPRNICGAEYDLWAVNTEPESRKRKRTSRSQAGAGIRGAGRACTALIAH